MCAKACLRVDLESVLEHFKFKMYQSKKEKRNFTMYQSKKIKFYNVSEQVKNFKMYQSKLNFLRCIKAS